MSAEFRQLVNRILRCREAEDEAKDATKDVYAEAKANGYDVVALGLVVRRIRQETKGFRIYFASFDQKQLLKIGISKQVSKRIKRLEADVGCPARLLMTVPGMFADEGWYHSQFNAYRVKGEWFRLCPETLRLVEVAREHGLQMWSVQ